MSKEEIIKRKNVALIIKNARIQKSLTQNDLAEKVGYSRLTIVRIEKGVFSPNADQLYKLCDVLDLEINIGGESV